MRKITIALGLSLALLLQLNIHAANAQAVASGSAVQQSGSQNIAGSVCQVAVNPAVNTQNTLTFAVPSGQYLYLTHLYLSITADGTGGTTLNEGRFTTTNLQSLEWDISFAGTAFTSATPIIHDNSGAFVKSALGPLNVTIVSPAGGAHNAYPMSACGYFAN